MNTERLYIETDYKSVFVSILLIEYLSSANLPLIGQGS
jgi:hypothetical protein